jgi:hypothetical protein
MILLLNGVSAGPVSGPALHHVAQPDGRVLDIAVLILPGAYFRGEHPAAVHPGQVVVCAVRSVDEATSERLVKQVIVIRRDLRTQELLAVYEQALQAGLVVHLITDGGLTEFGGVPTRTCLGIGPGYDDRIDPVTGDLELY